MKIKIAITDSRIRPEEERRLILAGFKVITLPPFTKLSLPVASHTDMLMCKIDNEIISFADYSEEAAYIFADLSAMLIPCGMKFVLTDDGVSNEYPNDAKLNVLQMGKKIFCNTQHASRYILKRAESLGYEIIHTRQGYPACTVLKLNDYAAITADRGMASVLTENGIRVTLIENGDIELYPYEYGFIGGCGAVYEGKLYLFGNPLLHRNADKIFSAAEAEGIEIIPLCNETLHDLGGILFTDHNTQQHCKNGYHDQPCKSK